MIRKDSPNVLHWMHAGTKRRKTTITPYVQKEMKNVLIGSLPRLARKLFSRAACLVNTVIQLDITKSKVSSLDAKRMKFMKHPLLYRRQLPHNPPLK